MRTQMLRVLNMKKFFKIVEPKDTSKLFTLKKPSLLLLNNIYVNWLQFMFLKTHKHIPIFTNIKYSQEKRPPKLPFGSINTDLCKYGETCILELDSNFSLKKSSTLELNIAMPPQDSMQYFIQWQRYRKFWWSSITTTASLFDINEITYENESANANIIAKFPWGHKIVETISINSRKNDFNASELTCSMFFENSLFILLLDGIVNNSKEEYLRLHRNMAPYKLSFALNVEKNANIQPLSELAKVMCCKLKNRGISTLVPNFTHTWQQQITENLHLGVTYTAVLSENTLVNGIIHLLNSSTMLKEQIHIVDFDSYAALLCKN